MTARKLFEEMDPAGWDPLRLTRILAEIQGKKILVLGDVGIDRYTIGSVERISPEAPVPIVVVEEERYKLGLAANVADNVKTLGGFPMLLGVVGSDRAATDFRGLLKEAGIEAQYLVADRSRRTVLKERIVSERQQLLRVDYESPHEVAAATETQVLRKFRAMLSKADGVILEDYAKGLLTEKLASGIFKAAREAGKPVSVDPNVKSAVSLYRGAHVLTPNTREAEGLSGIAIRDADSLVAAGRKILKSTGAKHVVITRGKEGMAVFSNGGSRVRVIPTYAREVYDVSGAGDTVISVLTMALSAGATIDEACVLGNLAAGVEVGKRGTATVSPEEVRLAIEFFSLRRGSEDHSPRP